MKIFLVLLVLGFIALIARLVTGEATAAMISRRFGPTLCRLIGHRRRGDAVRKIDGVYHSQCRRCGVKLAKASRDGAWQAAAEEGRAEPATEEPLVAPDRASVTKLLTLVALFFATALTIGLIAAPRHIVMRSTAASSPSSAIGNLSARI